jgi:hypothetical protein
MTDVAIFNSNESLMTLLEAHLWAAGLTTIHALLGDFQSGRQDLLEFLAAEDPQVLLIDLPAPYRLNWQFARLIENLQASQGRQFVLTTPQRGKFIRLVGSSLPMALEDEEDLNEVVAAVCRAHAQAGARLLA